MYDNLERILNLWDSTQRGHVDFGEAFALPHYTTMSPRPASCCRPFSAVVPASDGPRLTVVRGYAAKVPPKLRRRFPPGSRVRAIRATLSILGKEHHEGEFGIVSSGANLMGVGLNGVIPDSYLVGWVHCLSGAAHEARRGWMLRISRGTGLSLAVPMSHEDAKAFLRGRDRQDGRRLSPILTQVNAWINARGTLVQSHMRGTQGEFTMGDYRITLLPPPDLTESKRPLLTTESVGW